MVRDNVSLRLCKKHKDHHDFSKPGKYKITILATNKNGLSGSPKTVEVEQNVGGIDTVSSPELLNDSGTATLTAGILAVGSGVAAASVTADITFPDGSIQ